MNTLIKLTLRTFFIGFVLIATTYCKNNNPEATTDPKERAEDMNEEKFGRKEEKDADRIVDAYLGNIYEIRASEEAVNKATTPEVKKNASMMVEAHNKMKTELTTLASKKNITLPTNITDRQQRKLEKLTEKTAGIDYDEEYIDQMRDKHEDAEDELEKLSKNAEDSEIRTWAAGAVAEVRAHLDMLKATDKTLDEVRKQNRDKNTWRDNKSDMHNGKDEDVDLVQDEATKS